jgi:hypothetical protein
MKRFRLSVPENITIYADMLINKVHVRPRPAHGDVQQKALAVIRTRQSQTGMSDYRSLLAGPGEPPR